MAEIAVFQDQQSSGVSGTTLSNTLTTASFNTDVANTISGCTRSGSDITVPIGVYVVQVYEPQALLASSVWTARITDDSNVPLGGFTRGGSTGNDSGRLTPIILNITSETVIRYRTKVSGAIARGAQSVGTEYYQKIMIQKVG